MLDPSKATKYLNQIQHSSMGIIEAFKKQQNTAIGSLLGQSGFYKTKIYVHRSTIGTKKNLKNFLPNGSLHVINLLTKLRNPSSESPQIHSPSTIAKHTTSEIHEDSYHEDG